MSSHASLLQTIKKHEDARNDVAKIGQRQNVHNKASTKYNTRTQARLIPRLIEGINGVFYVYTQWKYQLFHFNLFFLRWLFLQKMHHIQKSPATIVSNIWHYINHNFSLSLFMYSSTVFIAFQSSLALEFSLHGIFRIPSLMSKVDSGLC
jgi:hypothetical protein